MPDPLKARFMRTGKLFINCGIETSMEELQKKLQRFMHASDEYVRQLLEGKNMKVKIVVLDEFKHLNLVPKRATVDSAGFDLCAAEDVIVPAVTCCYVDCEVCKQRILVHVPGRRPIRNGVMMEIPIGWEGQVRPRSGLARKNGISIPNSPATIDSDYRGELVTTLINHGGVDFVVKAGDRIAQVLFKQIHPVVFEVVTSLSETARGSGGFGSTGR